MPQGGTVWGGLVGAIYAAALLVAAVPTLFYGWKLYRLFAALISAMAAAVIGWFYVAPMLPAKLAFLAPMVLGIGGGMLAIPLQRCAAFVAHGAFGALAAVAVASQYGVPLDLAARKTQVAAAVGFLIVGIAAAIFLRFFVVFGTAAYGALSALAAAVVFPYGMLGRTPPIDRMTVVAVAAAWSILTVTGMVHQYKLIKAEKGRGKAKK